MKTRMANRKNSERLERSGPLSVAFRQNTERRSVDRLVSDGLREIFDAVKAARGKDQDKRIFRA